MKELNQLLADLCEKHKAYCKKNITMEKQDIPTKPISEGETIELWAEKYGLNFLGPIQPGLVGR